MVSPLMSVTRRGENRRNMNNTKYTPVGMKLVSPTASASPIDTRMTPIRKSLFQRRRISSTKRKKGLFVPHVEDDSRDDSVEIEGLKSANRKKDSNLKALQERFSHIQKGLGSIDEERSQLVEKAKRLDKEKQIIKKQLELREREILTLIKRCASQEEKMRETSKLRANNRDLHKHLDLMASKLRVIEEDSQDRQSLQKLLQESELDREQLRDRLAKVQREHDAIADTLQECLGNIRKLTEEKNAIEEERRNERKRAQIELEKQHLAHVNDSNTLKQSIQEHQNQILEMESILQDKIKSNTDLRREKAVMSQGQHEEIREVVEKYERQIAQLRDEINENMEQKNEFIIAKDLEEVNLLKEKLRSKDEQIQDLEKEFSDQMVSLMSKQSSLDESEEERKNLEQKVESAKQLEIKHAALLDFVEILDSNLADLTSTNAHLQLEKDELREETDELRKKTDMLQRLCSSLQNNQKAKESDFRDLLNVEKDEIRKELQESLRKAKLEVSSLQAELENRNERIAVLESDLQQAQKLITDKEKEIKRIVEQMEGLRATLGGDLRKARLEAARFEADVFAKNQALASLEGRLEGAKAVREASINAEKDRTMSTGDSKDDHTDLERTIQEIRNEAMFLQQKIESLSSEKAKVEEEVEKSRSLINDRDDQIVEVQQMVLKHEKRAVELERKLQEATKQLAEHREKLPSHQYAKIEVAESNSRIELEQRILGLEKELSEAKTSQSKSIADLGEAQRRIEKLEEQLVGRDAQTVSLENQLQNATKELVEEQSRACNAENEYYSMTLLQTERETYNEETRSKIFILEETIAKMREKSNELGVEIEECRRENADKDMMISSLKEELEQGQAETDELRSELQNKYTEMEKLELLLSEQDKDFEMQMQATNNSLKNKEERIVELEKIISVNDEKSKNLQDLISKAKDDIARLEEAADNALNEVSHKNDLVATLTKAADGLKLDLENVRSEMSSKDDTIKKLENALNDERASRSKLEGEISLTKEYVSESEKIKEALTKEIEEKKRGESKAEEDLLEAKQALEAVNNSSSEHISRLESQISQMTADSSRKDIEIRDLRFEQLSLKKSGDTESLLSEIESLKSQLQSKLEVESELESLMVGLNERDQSIEQLKAALMQAQQNEEEASKQRDAFQKAEKEARDQIEDMKFEYEHAAARDNELMNIRLKNEEALQKEELENAQAELESTQKKLLDSERLLVERARQLGEIVDQNRKIELELEREQSRCRAIEEKFAEEQKSLETTRSDLKKVQTEFRRKESLYESKLKEERNQRKSAEESLRSSKNKYEEAAKAKRNATELERENTELKDKIRRQEAYLKRKLDKENRDRARLTPSKITISPSRRLSRTPDKTSPTKRAVKSSSKGLSQSSMSSRSKLQAPSTIGRKISSGIPSIPRNRSKISPSAASTNSMRTTRSVFSRSPQFQFQTPSKQLSAQDILQSELDDDRSASSELSSILRSPNRKTAPGAKVPDWELEPIE